MKLITYFRRAGIVLAFALAAFSGSADASDLQAHMRVVSQRAEMAELVRDASMTIRRQAQDYKNLLLRGSDPADYRVMMGRFETQKKGYRNQLERLRTMMKDGGLPLDRIDGLLAEQARLVQAYGAAFEQFDPSDKMSTFRADAASRGKDVRSFVELEALLAEIDHSKAQAWAQLRDSIAKEAARCP